MRETKFRGSLEGRAKLCPRTQIMACRFVFVKIMSKNVIGFRRDRPEQASTASRFIECRRVCICVLLHIRQPLFLCCICVLLHIRQPLFFVLHLCVVAYKTTVALCRQRTSRTSYCLSHHLRCSFLTSTLRTSKPTEKKRMTM